MPEPLPYPSPGQPFLPAARLGPVGPLACRRATLQILAWASPIPEAPTPGPPQAHTTTRPVPTPPLPSFLATAASFSESTSPKPTPLSSRTWAANWREHKVKISSGIFSHPVPISRFPGGSFGMWGR